MLAYQAGVALWRPEWLITVTRAARRGPGTDRALSPASPESHRARSALGLIPDLLDAAVSGLVLKFFVRPERDEGTDCEARCHTKPKRQESTPSAVIRTPLATGGSDDADTVLYGPCLLRSRLVNEMATRERVTGP